MSHFTTSLKAVYNIFDREEWRLEGIPTFPDNVKSISGEHIVVNTIPSGPSLNTLSKSGIVVISIYTQANRGPGRAFEIADCLDKYLLSKSFSLENKDALVLYKSSLTALGVDISDKSLYRHNYTIPFTYYGAY